jgi:hypothetical protein
MTELCSVLPEEHANGYSTISTPIALRDVDITKHITAPVPSGLEYALC